MTINEYFITQLTENILAHIVVVNGLAFGFVGRHLSVTVCQVVFALNLNHVAGIRRYCILVIVGKRLDGTISSTIYHDMCKTLLTAKLKSK